MSPSRRSSGSIWSTSRRGSRGGQEPRRLHRHHGDLYLRRHAESVEITLTGILAAAHLRGYPATIDLLLNGTLSTDEYGTSILQYIDQFGGYDFPAPTS